MHDSVMYWVSQVLQPGDVEDQAVTEAGAFNVNGSVRDLLTSWRPASYFGVDIRSGPYVDAVMNSADLPAESADLVISTEMLEHAQGWQHALSGMAAALRPAGLLLLTTRGPGFGRHDHPGDYWRFTCPQLARAVVAGLDLDLERIEPDPDYPGVFLLARRPVVWRPSTLSGYAAWSVDQTEGPW